MTSSTLSGISKKIKAIRTNKMLKLTEVAEKAKISKGLLSRIENGRVIPSLPVLLQIIKTLEVDYATFFDGIDNDLNRGYLLIRKADYERIEKEDAIGFQYFSILSESVGNVSLDFNLLELSPNAQREKVTTQGYTYLFLIRGSIEYILDDEVLVMNEGDSLFFNATIPHVPKNPTTETAKIFVLYIISPDKNI